MIMIRGIIRGNSIDLDHETGLRDGQRVSVVVEALPDDESPAGDARGQNHLRGIVSIPRTHRVLATSDVEICTSRLPRRRPQIVLTRRMLDADDD
jgi:hypothetical protein